MRARARRARGAFVRRVFFCSCEKKMAAVLTEKDCEGLCLGEPRNGKGGMTLRGITNGRLERRLSETLDCEILYEPSVFQGTGAETRLNIVIRAPETATRALHAIEEAILPSGYLSCLRENGAIRAKIDVTKAVFYDHEEEVPPPATFCQKCNAVVEIRGTYSTRQASGLLIEVTALQLGGVKRENPFK